MRYQGVVFSGLPGAGKSALVDKLAAKYGWPVFSAGGQWRKKYEELCQDQEITFEEYWRGIPLDEKRRFANEVDQVYAKGNVIGDSRYAINLRTFPLLLVFVTADLETRAARALALGKYGESDLENIKSILTGRERDETEAGFGLFDYDYRDPNFYHLVINSTKLTINEEAAIVESIVGS